MIDKETFITNFAVQFLASYAANIYDESCAYGQHDRLVNLPFEDAVDIAKTIYEETITNIKRETNE